MGRPSTRSAWSRGARRIFATSPAPSSRWPAGWSPTARTPTPGPGRTSCSSTPSRRTSATRRWPTLSDIADQCDGVRCDMAMLMMNETFARTWGARVGAAPASDYWPEVIAAVREGAPGLLLHRRGLLGPRVGAPVAGFRLLLRQAALRPPAARDRRGRAAAPDGRHRLPAGSAAIRREPRRAPSGLGASSRTPPSGGGGDADPGRRPTRPRRPDRGPTDPAAGLLGSLPR